MQYRTDDHDLQASVFISFVNKIWPGNYDIEKTQIALSKTINITAYDDKLLVGCLRILSDGYYFGTITELLVLPEYQKQGIGSKLLQLAKDNTPTMLYFGAQPGVEIFYKKNGCQKGLQSYIIERKR
ncbi:GNAT family N-acetyltransferase [Lachnospiraceae bacterium 46-15]